MGKEVEFPPFPSKILPGIFHEEGSFTAPFLKTETGSQLWLFVSSKARCHRGYSGPGCKGSGDQGEPSVWLQGSARPHLFPDTSVDPK